MNWLSIFSTAAKRPVEKRNKPRVRRIGVRVADVDIVVEVYDTDDPPRVKKVDSE